jgi:aminoglycoside phosphotransferase (APT) family kinase protein
MKCFEWRLARTWRHAQASGFEAFTTSLTVGPRKNSQTIFDIGRKIGGEHFYAEDFKKRGGFQRSVELARDLGLYRQNFCGCVFSQSRRDDTSSTSAVPAGLDDEGCRSRGLKPTVNKMPSLRDFSPHEYFVKLEPIHKGWSGDKKFCATDRDGVKHLLRVSPASRHDARKALFGLMEKMAALGVPMCLPEKFGTCEEGVYTLQSWIDGEDLETLLPSLPEAAHDALGLEARKILKKIHTIPAPATQEDWEARYNRKIDAKIERYRACGLRFEGDGHLLAYLAQNRHLLKNRPQCFQHGDYHVGNMMLENGALKIIDFDRHEFGDPWEEFNSIVWSALASPRFASGQLRGYFDGDPPPGFFKTLALYMACNTLASIPWAIPFGTPEVENMIRRSQDALAWFDNMRNPVPSWYGGAS